MCKNIHNYYSSELKKYADVGIESIRNQILRDLIYHQDIETTIEVHEDTVSVGDAIKSYIKSKIEAASEALKVNFV